MEKQDDNKMNTGIRVDKDLWRAFRIRTIQDGTKMGALIEGWVKDHLKRAPGKNEVPDPEKGEVPDPESGKDETSGKEPGGKRPTRGNYPEPD